MHRRLIIFLTLMLALVALGAAPAAAAAPKAAATPIVVVEPIDDWNVHEEPDGSTVESRQLGTRRTATYADGRVVMTERYTLEQTARTGLGDLIYRSTSTHRSTTSYKGEFTLFRSMVDHTDMLWGDGRDCDIDVRMLVVRNRVIFHEQVGPVCSTP